MPRGVPHLWSGGWLRYADRQPAGGQPQAAGAAVLEMTLQGGKYQFDGDAVFALAGADMPAALDGRPVPAYTPLLARAGQVLAIGAARSGLRGYLAVFGGVDTPPVLGSRSTDLKCRMGGLDGRALKAGDVLPIGAAPAMVEQRWQQICAKGANRPLGTARTPARPWRFLGGRKLPLFRAVPGPRPMPLPQWGRPHLYTGYML